VKIALGTVQFGLDYGINNPRGRIPKKEVSQILEYASQQGIHVLDTAFSYGDSEMQIGKFIAEDKNKFNIITKTPQKGDVSIQDAVIQSLQSLNASTLYGYLLHDFDALREDKTVWADMEILRAEGKVKKIGVSLYSPQEIDFLIENSIKPDLVQVPYSVFDQRFGSACSRLKKEGVEIHVRSVFLQGLVFKQPEELENSFSGIKDKLSRLHAIAGESNIPLAALCVNFALNNEWVDYAVIGVDSLDNLKENLNFKQYRKQSTEVYAQLLELKESDEELIVPTRWAAKT